MKLLQLHMLRRLAIYGGALTVSASLVTLLTGSLGMTDLLAQGALSFGDFLIAMTALLPMVLVIVTPLASATGIICCYHSWNRRHEIVASSMAGASPLSMALPGIAAAFIAAVVTGVMSLYLLPESFRLFEDIRYAAIHNVGFAALHEGLNDIEPNLSLAFDRRLSSSEILNPVILDERDPDVWVMLSAPRGQFIRLDHGQPTVVLEEGEYVAGDRRRGVMRKIAFDHSQVPLAGAATARPWQGFFEKHVPELLFPLALRTEDRLDEERLWAAEAHRRIASPLLCLGYGVFVVALLLHGSSGRAGASVQLLSIFGAVVAWHTLMTLGHAAIARVPQLIPVFYFLAAIPGLAGCALLIRLDRFTAARQIRTGRVAAPIPLRERRAMAAQVFAVKSLSK